MIRSIVPAIRYPTGFLVFLMSIFLWTSTGHTQEEHVKAASRGLVGEPAPRLTVQTIDGKAIDLGELYGKKAVYLKFWATWCVPCRKQMPHFEETFQKAGPDLAIVSINIGHNDTLADVRAFLNEHKVTVPTVIDDGQLAAAFNLRVTPQHVIIGRDGRIQYIGHFVDERLETALVAARTSVAPAAAPGAPKDLPQYKPGDSVAKLAAVTLDGESFPVRHPSQARPTVLVFLSAWCESYLQTSRPAVSASCRTAREEVERLAGSDHARWLGIASGIWTSQEDVRSYRKKYNVTIALTLDESGELFRSFRVLDVPTLVVIDAQGRVTRRIEGSEAKLGDVLEAALSQ